MRSESAVLNIARLLFLLPLASSFGRTFPRLRLYESCASRDNEMWRVFGKHRDDERQNHRSGPTQDGDLSSHEDDPILESAIDSFLSGEYDRPFSDDAPAPFPKLSPGATIETALRSLRQLDEPEPSHGAAVLSRFCAPLTRAERWGGEGSDPWKELLRGALTPSMLARRIRASEFSGLLDWEKLDVTEGMSLNQQLRNNTPSVAFVNAALYFRKGVEPSIIQFTLRRVASVWLIDKARLSKRGLFFDDITNDGRKQ